MIYRHADVEHRVAIGRLTRHEADVMHGFARALRKDSGVDLRTLDGDALARLGREERGVAPEDPS